MGTGGWGEKGVRPPRACGEGLRPGPEAHVYVFPPHTSSGRGGHGGQTEDMHRAGRSQCWLPKFILQSCWGGGRRAAEDGLGRGAGHPGWAGLGWVEGSCCVQDPVAPRPGRRLSRRAVAKVSGLPWGAPAPVPGRLCQGGVLHRLVWQQVMVIRVPSAILVMGSHLSAHHTE